MSTSAAAARSPKEAAVPAELQFMDQARLEKLAAAMAESYQNASPFPHIVIDDFLPPEDFQTLKAAFPGPEADIWYRFKSGKENRKLQSQTWSDLPWTLRLFLNEANGQIFTRFLERMTGIAGLVPDPHLYGGGLHQTLPGGHLGVHIDYNFHKDWNLDRRLNAILYLNDEWDESWGGDLEFWDREVENCVERVSPKGNRLVVFSTNEHSWHGHPTPLACPEGVTRKSIALYYYTNGRPEEERGTEHNTVFKERPGERFAARPRDLLLDFVPPILVKVMRGRKAS